MQARASRQADLVAIPTLDDVPSGKRVTGGATTTRTNEAIRPTQVVEVIRALRFRGEKPLKLQQRPRPLLVGEWCPGFNVIGQRGRVMVRNFGVSHSHLRHRKRSDTANTTGSAFLSQPDRHDKKIY